jgi:UDP-N-acetyl-D-glucosamine dehydrogenase
MSKVLIVGLGYVGLPLAVRAAQVGHRVIGIDAKPSSIEILQSGHTYIEDVTDADVVQVIGNGRLTPMLTWGLNDPVPDVAREFDIAIIAVPTPLRDGGPDLSYVELAGHAVGRALCRGGMVVLESTTYAGTTEGLLRDALEYESGLVAGIDFELGYSPERIDPGSKTHTLQNTPKLVSATTINGLQLAQDFYDTIVDQTVPVSSPRVAEMTKLYENIQANTNIALVNEVAELCHDLNVNVWEVIDAAMTKGHSMAYWTPGPGVGGHCLPIDPMYLAWQASEVLGKPFRFAELADTVNHQRPVYAVQRAKDWLERDGCQLHETEVLVMGAAYKPNVGDVRESPAVEVVHELHRHGAHVTVVDPHVNDNDWPHGPLLPFEDLYPSMNRFGMVMVITDHDVFEWDKVAMEARRVLDCRNALPIHGNVEAL